MIQRIQTIYLLLVTFVMISMIFFPLAHLSNDLDAKATVDVFGIHGQNINGAWSLVVLPITCALLSTLIIFFYKRRKLQINLSYLLMFSTTLIYVFGGFLFWDLVQKYTLNISFTLVCTFPIIALILEILAIRGMKKDEKLIRSLDRIRP